MRIGSRPSAKFIWLLESTRCTPPHIRIGFLKTCGVRLRKSRKRRRFRFSPQFLSGVRPRKDESVAEPAVAPDRGGTTVFHGSKSHRPPRQVNVVVRVRHDVAAVV